MIKIKPFWLLLFVFCAFAVGCLANLNQASSVAVSTAIVAADQSKQDLVIAVLSEAGIAKQYDLYLGNSVDIVVPLETTSNDKFMAWLQALCVREAGWDSIAAQYIDQLEKDFSETELRELLALTQQSLVARLVQSEMEAYAASAAERRRLLAVLWENYNSGVFTPPPEIFQ